MITDGERRAVAEILRKMRVERYNSILNGIHLGESVGVGAQIVSPHEDQVRAAADRLADLIEPESERTCNVDSSHVEREMGDYSYLEVELSCGHAFTWDDGTPPDYCPYCGARIVWEETGNDD